MNKTLKGYYTAQFFGAFNDNAWKMLVVFLAAQSIDSSKVNFEQSFQLHMTEATIALTLPFILISLPASIFVDWISKRSLIRLMKGVEVLLMTLTIFALTTSSAFLSFLTPLTILVLMGVQSAILSPAKYGILPEIVDESKLSEANGYLELWTVLAIILGLGSGGFLFDVFNERLWIAGVILTFFSCIGFIGSKYIPHVSSARESLSLNVFKESLQAIIHKRIILLTIIGLAFFWCMATLLQQDIVVYIKSSLGESASKASLALAVCGLGIAIGSVMAGKISSRHIEMGLIPLGTIGLTLCSLLIGAMQPNYEITCFFMLFLGFSGGFIIVPLNAQLQWQAPTSCRGGVISLGNIIVFTGILIGSLATSFLSNLNFQSHTILIGAACLIFIGTLISLKLLPIALIRLIIIFLTKTFYRMKVIGREHIPKRGGALLVANHVSFIDWLFLIAACDRPVRFLVDASFFEKKLFSFFLKIGGAIPISAHGGARVVLKALRDAGDYLDRGQVVCIFAEGEITRTGMMQPFRRGLERIVKGRHVPIIPVYLDDVWGSIFSFESGRFITKLPRQLPFHMTVCIGEPLSSDASVAQVRKAVHDLSADAKLSNIDQITPLHHDFIRSCRRYPFKNFLIDDNKQLSRINSLAGAIALAHSCQKHLAGEHHVGVLLPPSSATAIANIALSLSAHVSVNLNFTTGQATFDSIVKQSNIKTIITHKGFLDTLNLTIDDTIKVIFIDELINNISTTEKFISLMMALCSPIRMIEKYSGAIRPIAYDDLATIIFSSGSTGEPKGVKLTHANINSNAQSIAQLIRANPNDRLLGILPSFHSFGFTSLWYAANHNLGIISHPNPLDGQKIGELVERFSATIMLATPTFLNIYLKRCAPSQFGSLRLVMTGAEKLSSRLAETFETQFGIRPLEGYGATECSPAIAMCTLDHRGRGFYQPGSQKGSIGQALPGVAIKIVDPDTFKEFPFGQEGLMLVKGPNVMQGYLNRDDLTTSVIKDGWYITGDIALMHEDGFIFITDRLSRFSKIGGEMVPHGTIEETLHRLYEFDETTFAVTAIEDEKKGERLAVLYTCDSKVIEDAGERLKESGLPNLFIPRQDHFIHVDALPILGTGKLDLKQIKLIAQEHLG